MSHLVQQFVVVFRAAFTLAQHECTNQLAPDAQWSNAPKPHAGNVAGRAEKGVAAFAAQLLRSGSMVQRVNVLGQQRKYGRLGKERKAGRGDGSQHRGLLLKAEKRACGSVGRAHDQLQSSHSGRSQITLPCQYRSKIREDLRGKIRVVKRVRQYARRKTP